MLRRARQVLRSVVPPALRLRAAFPDRSPMRSYAAAALVVAVGARAHADPTPPSDAWARTTLATRVSLSPDGPWLPRGPGGGAQLEVHDGDGPRLRVLERRYWAHATAKPMKTLRDHIVK